MVTVGFSHYIKDQWNRGDQAMFFTMLAAVILRFIFANDSDFVWARYVYVVDIIMFYTRFLLMYHIHKRLGPQVAVMWRMVGSTCHTVLHIRCYCDLIRRSCPP